MRLPVCEFESQAAQAQRSGAWPAGLREHLPGCALCAEVLLIAEFLQQEAESTETQSRLPGPGFLWWKSQRLRRALALERATRTIAWARNLAAVVCGAALLWLLAVSAPKCVAFLASPGNPSVLWSSEFPLVWLLCVAGPPVAAILGVFLLLRADQSRNSKPFHM